MKVRGVTVTTTRGTQSIVKGFDADVDAGHIVAIVGETGAGKTMSTKAVLGLLPSGLEATGTVQIGEATFDISHGQTTPLLGSQTSMVLQNPAGMLDPRMRIGRQIIEGVVARGNLERRAAVEKGKHLLQRMGFADVQRVWDLYPHQLSGGMSQRAGIAMALMPSPSLLVVDEPTSALDAHVRNEVLRLIQQEAVAEGAAVMLISHDLRLVGDYADQVIVMRNGGVVEAGPAGSVLVEPTHSYTRGLLEVSPTLRWHHRQRFTLTAAEGDEDIAPDAKQSQSESERVAQL